MRFNFTAIFIVIYGIFLSGSVQSQIVMENTPELQKIDVIEHYGDQIPLSLRFTNSVGEPVQLKSLFQTGRPVLLTLVYFTILIPHIILAAVMVPFIIAAVYFALRQRYEQHVKLVRWVLPVWIYVSISGVLIYILLYRF